MTQVTKKVTEKYLVNQFTVKWGFTRFLTYTDHGHWAKKGCMFKGFPARFCLKLALYCCPKGARTTCGWHLVGPFSHRKPIRTWSKGFVLPSEIRAGACGSAGAVLGLDQSQHRQHSYSFCGRVLQTSWLGESSKLTMPLLCDGHGDLCPLQMCL